MYRPSEVFVSRYYWISVVLGEVALEGVSVRHDTTFAFVDDHVVVPSPLFSNVD